MNVSVCIPTYNQVAYVEQAILSAANQTVKPFEIIVCDDCSTDGTLAVLAKLEGQIPMLKVFVQPVNRGISENVDYCLRKGTGDYVVRLDSDDLLLPEYIEKLSDLLNKFPNAGYAHAAVREIDQYGNFKKDRKLWRLDEFLNADAALKAAVFGYKVAANIIMFRKEALAAVNYITLKTNFCEDYYLCAQISAIGYGNAYYSGFLSCYRAWGANSKINRKIAEIKGLIAVFEEVLQPAFEKKGWYTGLIKKSREIFAINHADSLAWKVYAAEEEIELKNNILKLSDSGRVRFYLWLYENNFGNIVKFYASGIRKIKNSCKNVVLPLLRKQGE